jgi:hypothetical protein
MSPSCTDYILIKKIYIKKSLLTKQSPVPDRFTAKCYETFKEDLISTLLKLFHKILRERTVLNSSYEPVMTPKLNKDTIPKENYKQFS